MRLAIKIFFIGALIMVAFAQNELLKGVRWLGHASFLIERAGKVIYFDPFQLSEGLPKADVVFITHTHFDHLSVKDIEKIATEKTQIVATADAFDQLKGYKVKTIKPGEELEIQGIKVKTVPAYNVGKRFHPKEKGWVGYIVEIGGVSFYHAGDTDFIPEMKGLKADVAFLPIGGTYTMDWKEGVEACKNMDVKICVPMHWGSIVGSREDAENFKASCKRAVILEAEK